MQPSLLSVWLAADWVRRSAEPFALGREFTRRDKPLPGEAFGRARTLIGGGPGIVMSAGALAAMRAANCSVEEFPIISEAVPGGDGWLGQCFEKANVKTVRGALLKGARFGL